MTDPLAASVAISPQPGGDPDPARTPGAGDYVRGVVAVVGVLALIVAVAWLALVIVGLDFCGCTTRPPATPIP